MRLGLGFASLALAVSLVACSERSGAIAPLKTTPEQVEAHVTKLGAEAFSLKAEGPANLDAVRGAMPKGVSLAWGKLDFDAATGATVLTDVKLTPTDMPQVGLGIAEMRLWDFDAEFAKARLSGQRLTESGKLARRIEAKGVSVFGLETLMGPAMQAYTGALADVVTDQAGPNVGAQVQADLDMKLDSYAFAIDRLIFDDVMLRPYELKPVQLPADNELAEVMPVLQGFMAVSRSFAADAMAAFDMKAQMAMTEAGAPFAFNAGIKSYGVRGMRGSDADAAFLRGVTFDGTISDSELPKPVSFSGGIDLMTMEGIRLDKLAGYLARGEWPPRSETDLLSIGRLISKGEHYALNGETFYSVEESLIDLSGWHWFIPTKARLSATNVVYNLGSLFKLVDDFGAAAPASDDPLAHEGATTPAIPPEVIALMTRYGLDKPSMDFTVGWNWNPTTGATVIDGAFGLDNYLRTDIKYEGGLPTFKSVSDLVPDNPEAADGEAIGKVFEANSTLKLVEFNLADEGGLDKIFAMIPEAIKLMPEDPSGGMLAGRTPENLRRMASDGVYTLANMAEQTAPELKALLLPFGAFIKQGGRVKLTLKPKAALALAATMESFEKGELTPQQLIQKFNATAVHTPPTPAKP